MSNLLLECLFQVRALRDTVGRVRDLAATAPTEADAGELLQRVRGMLAAEARWQEMLRGMLPAKLAEGFVPPEMAFGACGDPVEAFARARISTHAALDACNARDLGRLWPLEVAPPAPPGPAASPFDQSPSGASPSGASPSGTSPSGASPSGTSPSAQPPAAEQGEDVPAADQVPADVAAVDAEAAKGRTVADVVAMMLANDTNALGGLKYRFRAGKR